jgi:hypothetical protein
MDGGRAARRIVDACRHGEPHLTLTQQARIAAAAAAVMPGLTARALAFVNRLLPAPSEDGENGGAQDALPGWQQATPWAPSLLTRLADEAAVANNELHGAALGYGKEIPST